ncbi:cytochrome c [Thiomicrorhabdus sp. ZW0627]|uniref:c-type cytochrome n=1 Tax=Thiomicrorhabdus sp. ZW0627 TaxID=3039774 RepID=UPI002436838E|nr:cytochrome c [Thiomicrorhabdus sp. ZW0627]MDG6774562.1 cytochrome c [Thiomicrorhabdus sp. ZW0627]
MFSTKKTFVAAAVATLFAGSASAMSDSSNGAASGEKIDGKYAANYAEIIKENGGKYLDAKVIEAILGKDATYGRDGLEGKLDPANPYSFEVDDSIDGGNHGNAQCKVPAAFTEVHESVNKNYYSDANFTAYGFGTPIAESAMKKWNITVDGDGKGLPDPSVGMTVEKGAKIYVQYCGMCHGEFGEGAKGYLPLAVDEKLTTSDFFEPAPMKAVGNYWPYAVTLFDYIRRTMPFWTPNAPFIGDAGYMGMTGYILQSNYVPMDDEGTELSDDTFFNSEVLMKMNKYMKNQGNFFCDHRPVVHNERCMTNCPDAEVGDGKGDIHNYRQARKLPDGTPQYNVPQRMHEDPPGVGHSGM